MAKKCKVKKESKVKNKTKGGEKPKKPSTFFIGRGKEYIISEQVKKVIKEKEREKNVLHLDKEDFNELGLNDIKYLSLNYQWKLDKKMSKKNK